MPGQNKLQNRLFLVNSGGLSAGYGVGVCGCRDDEDGRRKGWPGCSPNVLRTGKPHGVQKAQGSSNKAWQMAFRIWEIDEKLFPWQY